MVWPITGAEFYVSVAGKSMKVRELAVVSRSVSLLVAFFMLLGTAIDRHRGRQLTGLSKPGKSCGVGVTEFDRCVLEVVMSSLKPVIFCDRLLSVTCRASWLVASEEMRRSPLRHLPEAYCTP